MTNEETSSKRIRKREKNEANCVRGKTEENKRVEKDEVLDEEEDEEKEEEDEYVEHYQKRNVKEEKE